MAAASLVAVTGCASRSTTILIPRAGPEQPVPPDGALSDTAYELERTVDGRTYALRAGAFDETLVLAAAVDGPFRGGIVWRAGDLELRVRVEPGESTAPVDTRRVGGRSNFEGNGEGVADAPDLEPALVRVVGTGGGRTLVSVGLPHGTLRRGDGALVLRFVPDDGSAVRLPATGRLRGVYIAR